jgi:hypothetical protein
MAEEPKPRFNFSDPNAKSTPSAEQTTAPPAPSVAQSPYSSVAPAEFESSPARFILGLIAGLAVGLLCGWLYALFVSATHFGFALITAGIGWIIGFVVLVVGGRTGLIPAVLTGLVAAVSLFASRYMLVGMELDKLGGAEAKLVLQSDPIGITLKSFGWSPMSIVVLLVGVYGAFKLTYEEGVSHD